MNSKLRLFIIAVVAAASSIFLGVNIPSSIIEAVVPSVHATPIPTQVAALRPAYSHSSEYRFECGHCLRCHVSFPYCRDGVKLS